MKILLLIVPALLLGACVRSLPPETPHTAAIERHLATAHSENLSAQASAQRMGQGITAARRDASRIDAKATVVLRWLDGKGQR